MSTAPPVLQPNHPLLQDGLNDGFRAPDLGWVGTHRDTEFELTPLDFNNGSAIFSNFWVGTVDQAKAFAQALVEDMSAWLPGMKPEDNSDEFIPVISVCYWEDATSKLGLVATQSLTPDFMFDAVPETFTAFKRFGHTLRQVAFDGNDNYPSHLLHHLTFQECAREEATNILSLALSVAEADQQENVQEVFDEYYPAATKSPSP